MARHPVYLLTGDEFLVDEALDRIRAETGADPLSEVIFGNKPEPREITEALETRSLLGGIRLVISHEAGSFEKAAVEALDAYLDAPAPDSVLVLVASGRTKLDAKVKKIGSLIALDAPKGRKLAAWIKERGRERGLRIDDRGAWSLIDAAGSGLRELDSALEQLFAQHGPNARVTQAEVRSAFPRLADERIYVFTDAVGERRRSDSMAILRRLLLQGEEPLVLLGALAAQTRRMLRAKRYEDGGPNAVGEALGLPRWRAERLLRQTGSYREDELVGAMQALAVADLDIKGGDLPPDAALEKAVLTILA